MLRLEDKFVKGFIREDELKYIEPQAQLAFQQLFEGKSQGSDFLGWLKHPRNYDRAEFERIVKAAAKIREESEILLVVGIGGSYLGARAVIEALQPAFMTTTERKVSKKPEVIFVGQQLSAPYLHALLQYIEGKEVSLNVISKSGTTTEPAVAFRILQRWMRNRYGAKSAERIYATTDKAKGALRQLAVQEGYETFVVPDDIGGRYSVLSAVGLLPIAAGGLDIEALMAGAEKALTEYEHFDVKNNPVCHYASLRTLLMRKGYANEVLVNFEPALHYVSEWWKQLYGESEGKDGKGLFPAAVDFTSDLHSMGQYIQDGRRILFETFVRVTKPSVDVLIPEDEANLDGLNFLSGRGISEVNHKAMDGTLLAHTDGGVPCLVLELCELNESELGRLLYFFEMACALSGYMNAVNPFDQPGVESYKKNMFGLLGKPGYESLKEELEKRL